MSWKTISHEGGMSYRQIAEVMGIDESTVREIEKSALAKLRKIPILREYYEILLDKEGVPLYNYSIELENSK